MLHSLGFSLSLRLAVMTLAVAFVGACSDPVSDRLHERSRNQPQWFEQAKLGIFIHWGLPSVPAFAAGKPLQPGELEEMILSDSSRTELPYSEWYLNSLGYANGRTQAFHREHYGGAPYEAFQQQFERNIEDSWDPEAWADLFQRAGARYVVLVTKHHDGYTLWPSKVINPNRADWGSRRDLVGELAAAVRARGMHFGTYYSTGLDWSFKMVTEGDLVSDILRSAPSSQDYADYVYDHLVELIDRYQPDVIWADIGYPSKGRLGELFGYYFKQVPEGAVNDRWGGVDVLGDIAEWPGAIWVLKKLARWLLQNQPGELTDDPDRYGFKTVEYSHLAGIAPFKWESTRGLGGSFGFNRRETASDMLNSAQLVEYLVETVAKNGNVLINVGPDSFGQIPMIQQAPLLGLGKWMDLNGEAVYGTRPWKRFQNENGRKLHYTQSDEALYAIVDGPAQSTFTIEDPGIEYSDVQVLGAQLVRLIERPGELELQLDRALEAAAVVVRYTFSESLGKKRASASQ
ncbi:MAG: alpha-L-fucosidase [Halieaceae bacterium]|nr:alpha-L-fucosidase [Halieaceae bacterium]